MTTAGGAGASGAAGAGVAGNSATGGTTGTAGATGKGGATVSGGGQGGTISTGGVPAAGAGGAPAAGGSTGAAGTPGTGGTTPGVDQGGVALAMKGQCTSTSRKYLNLGDMRIINNRWGSDALGCNGTTQQVCVNADGTVGWSFNRPTCGGSRSDPDYPEVEFGVAPFGTTSSNLTTPAFSSTTALPIQLKALTSATLNMDSFNTSFQKPNYWNSNFEFWISKQDPTKNTNAGVYAEIIIFLGWQSNRQSSNGGWPCMVSGTVTGTNYNLCHQSDSWSNGQWRFFNFIVGNGPLSSFSGKVDIKQVLDWIRSKYSGFTDDMWLTRVEVGTEIDDDTQGSVNIKNLTFEINGTSKSIKLAN